MRAAAAGSTSASSGEMCSICTDCSLCSWGRRHRSSPLNAADGKGHSRRDHAPIPQGLEARATITLQGALLPSGCWGHAGRRTGRSFADRLPHKRAAARVFHRFHGIHRRSTSSGAAFILAQGFPDGDDDARASRTLDDREHDSHLPRVWSSVVRAPGALAPVSDRRRPAGATPLLPGLRSPGVRLASAMPGSA